MSTSLKVHPFQSCGFRYVKNLHLYIKGGLSNLAGGAVLRAPGAPADEAYVEELEAEVSELRDLR